MVTLVTTIGSGAMDVYSQKLAERLSIPKIYSDIYQTNCESFNTPLLSNASLKIAWQDCCFIRKLNKLNTIIHLPNHHLGRYGLLLKVPFIITVHDLIRYLDLKGLGTFIHSPNLRDKIYLSLDFKGVKRALKIIAVSQATKRDLIRYLRIPEERITMIYEGIDQEVFKPTPHRMVPYPYILFVGSEHPRKNLGGVLRALSKLKQEKDFKGLKLIKVGRAGGREADFRKETMASIAALNLQGEVVFTEHVQDNELVAYYSHAECFVFPSVYEGFGFPPLEAMACGCPVVVSNSSSLPEVVGEAALQVSLNDVDGLAEAIRTILTNEDLRKDMVQRGFKQASKFSWQRTSQETMKVYQEAEEEWRG